MPFELTWTNKSYVCFFFPFSLVDIFFMSEKKEEESNQSSQDELLMLLESWCCCYGFGFWLSLTVTTLFIGMAWHGTDGLAFSLCFFCVVFCLALGTYWYNDYKRERKKCM